MTETPREALAKVRGIVLSAIQFESAAGEFLSERDYELNASLSDTAAVISVFGVDALMLIDGIIHRALTERDSLAALNAELLEALENLLAVHEGQGGTRYHAGDIARAAISKARGGE